MFRGSASKVSVLRAGAASLLAMAALSLGGPAHAQQTFLCEDGGSVTVLPGQLELMKRTDPCVARHFQDSLEPGPGQGQWQGQEPASEWQAATEEPPPGSAPMEAPLPAKKPEALMVAAGQQKKPADVKSDYRHVHIINAGHGAPQFYEHTR